MADSARIEKATPVDVPRNVLRNRIHEACERVLEIGRDCVELQRQSRPPDADRAFLQSAATAVEKLCLGLDETGWAVVVHLLASGAPKTSPEVPPDRDWRRLSLRGRLGSEMLVSQLARHTIHTWRDLLELNGPSLSRLRGFGPTGDGLEAVEELLASRGLRLRDRPEHWPTSATGLMSVLDVPVRQVEEFCHRTRRGWNRATAVVLRRIYHSMPENATTTLRQLVASRHEQELRELCSARDQYRANLCDSRTFYAFLWDLRRCGLAVRPADIDDDAARAVGLPPRRPADRTEAVQAEETTDAEE